MTDDVIAEAQDLLNRGELRRQIIEKLGVKYDTLRKAIHQGRLQGIISAAITTARCITHSTITHSGGGQTDSKRIYPVSRATPNRTGSLFGYSSQGDLQCESLRIRATKVQQ